MPRYYEDKPEGGACAGVKEDLGACLLQSACVLQVARPWKERRQDWRPVGAVTSRGGGGDGGGGRSMSSGLLQNDLLIPQFPLGFNGR